MFGELTIYLSRMVSGAELVGAGGAWPPQSVRVLVKTVVFMDKRISFTPLLPKATHKKP